VFSGIQHNFLQWNFKKIKYFQTIKKSGVKITFIFLNQIFPGKNHSSRQLVKRASNILPDPIPADQAPGPAGRAVRYHLLKPSPKQYFHSYKVLPVLLVFFK
jgi:hypothetical protein